MEYFKISMRVGFYQFAPKLGDKNHNLRKVAKILEKNRLDLLVLPELFNTGYVFESFDELYGVSEPINGPTARLLVRFAKDKNMVIVGGFAERSLGRVYNSALIVTPHNIHVYRKIHLFYKEKELFVSGDGPLVPYEVDGWRLGVIICFDWLFPEACRTLALKGADVIAHPANLVLPYAQNAMITRAIENGVYVILANRIGEERGIRFTGGSEIISPKGEILVKAPEDKEMLGIAEIDPKLARDKRFTPLNDIFEDRKPHLYFL